MNTLSSLVICVSTDMGSLLKLSEETENLERTLADGVIENGITEETLEKSKENQAEGDVSCFSKQC